MGNKIYFSGSEKGPVQEDIVQENESVKFYCNEKFWIKFDEDVSNKVEKNPDIGWFATTETHPTEFESKQVNPNNNKQWVIKIKFKDLPEEGLKYTVRLANGKTLDPRVVPPK